MKTYRINKNAARLAQGTGFAPELVYNISLVRFQGRNGRYIAAWTPGMKRPRYVYKARTPEEYDKAMECIRQEAERFRRHDEAQEKAAAAFRESLRVGDILYSSWGWEQTNIDFYQVIAIRGSAVDLRQLDQRTTEDGYMCGTTVPLPDVFKGKTHTHRLSKIISASTHTVLRGNGTGSPCGAVGMHNIMLLRISLRATACIKRSATSAARRSIGRLNI